MTHASLFSGIGGPEVAAAMMGWTNVFHCEINPFGRSILEYWFPKSESYDDITKTDFTKHRGQIDVLTGGFPCQPFSYAGKRGGSRTSVISGRKCSGLLTKSGPLGSLVKMLLESPLWWSPARLLTWEVKPLCSKRIMEFTDSELSMPLPSNASAEILNQRDIPSSRCLFRLALSELPTDETGSLLLPTPLAVEVNHTRRTEELKATGATSFHSRANGESRPNSIIDFLHFHDLLQTPTTIQMCESPESMRAEKNGYRNGTRLQELLPTPTAMEGAKYTNTYSPNSQMGQSLSAMAGSGMLPTPRANKVNDVEMTANLGMRHKHNLEEVVAKALHECCQKNDGKGFRLSAMAGSGMLPTPQARDYKGKQGCEYKKSRGEKADFHSSSIVGVVEQTCCQENGGKGSRLSPLFTEEMMGFPLMWTTLPFLSQSGETNL